MLAIISSDRIFLSRFCIEISYRTFSQEMIDGTLFFVFIAIFPTESIGSGVLKSSRLLKLLFMLDCCKLYGLTSVRVLLDFAFSAFILSRY